MSKLILWRPDTSRNCRTIPSQGAKYALLGNWLKLRRYL